ncbi:RraA family protein [Variovorax sp. KK3]|uniref:RraA family protein n=1 Tax=Variovorax sp. KK3 TaxID=1855728 RepID=UPI00097C591E|nr:RraA family protein [Variovorax sp. KK3]
MIAADLLARVTTSSVSDALMKRGQRQFMSQRIRGIGTLRVAGPAVTARREPIAAASGPVLPNARLIALIEEAADGSVLVFNGDPAHQAALWGGLMAAAAVARGLGGVVADGPVRDPDEIAELGCACFCTGAVPAGQAGILGLTGIGVPVQCGGITVHEGDFVLGDASGVVVIPQGMEASVLDEAAEIEARDQSAMKLLKQGLGLGEVMRQLGRA